MSFTRRVKRSLALTATGALALGLMPAGAAMADTDVCDNAPDAGFTDASGQTHTDEINCLVAYEIAQGRTADLFGTTAFLRRDSAATLFVNFAMVATDGAIADEVDEDKDVPFTDISNSVHEDEIGILYQLGLIKGTSDTTYSPGTFINRDQFATILYNAHVELGVPFEDSYETAFSDTSNSVHEDEINALAGEGIISGTGDGSTYSPSANVRRGQTATLLIESARVLDALEIWAAPRLPGDDVAGLTLLTIEDGVEFGDDDAADFVFASDGEGVDAFEITTDANFFIDGAAATRAFFEGNVATGDVLEVSADGDTFSVTTVELITEGVINENLNFIDPASGVELFDFSGIAFDQVYTVDGNARSETAFLNNLSTGDFLTAEVLVEDEDNILDSDFRHNLLNQEFTGEIVTGEETVVADGPNSTLVVLDPNPNDAWDVETFDFADGVDIVVDEDEDFNYLVDNDNDNDYDSFVDALGAGGQLTYSVSAGIATYSVVTVPEAPAEDTVISGTVVDVADGDILLGDDEITAAQIGTVTVFRVDGTLSTKGQLETALSAGDQITFTAPVEGSVSLALVNASLSGLVGGGDTAADEVDLLVDGELSTFDYIALPYGYEADTVFFQVDGSLVNQGAFETALNVVLDALPDDADADDYEAAVTFVQDGENVRVQLVNG